MKSIPVESGLPDAREALLPPSALSPDPTPVERVDHFPPAGSVSAGVVTVSRWTLTDDERADVLLGKDVVVALILPDGGGHPPMSLSIGPDETP